MRVEKRGAQSKIIPRRNFTSPRLLHTHMINYHTRVKIKGREYEGVTHHVLAGSIEKECSQTNIARSHRRFDFCCETKHTPLYEMMENQQIRKEEEAYHLSEPQSLKEYQKSIISKVGDSNSIIVLPTGSGKTVIAAEIIRRRVKIKGPKIALFIVPNRALVDQQAKVISHWTNLPVARHQGGGSKKPPSEQFDVLVGTPSALLALQDRMDLIQWKNVCICVFDEVHHTKKNHPYKTLADRISLYSSEKELQIIGLTASLVYDTQQDKIQRAVANIKQYLSIKNIIYLTENELRMQGHNSQTPIIDTSSSTTSYAGCIKDTFIERLRMGEGTSIEKKVYEVIKNMENVVMKFETEFVSPLGNPSVEWVNYVENFCGKMILDDDDDEKFNLFKRLGQMYEALRLMEYTNVHDSEELSLAWIMTQKILTPTADLKWGVVLSKNSKELQEMILRYKFPRLFNLKEKLLQGMLNSETRHIGQAIVFVEQKITAQIVSNYIQQDQQVSKLINANYVTAEHKPNMTREKIRDRIQEFREGHLHVLVATAVVEEGLDVPNVKIVVLFDQIHTPVVLQQRFGRARDMNPEIIVMSERHGRSIAELQNAIQAQKHIIERALYSDDLQPSPVNLDKSRSREKAAFKKFLRDTSETRERPIALLHEIQDKTKGQLLKKYYPCGSNFQCTLEYISELRKEGFKASEVGTSKKSAEKECALKILLLLRTAFLQDYNYSVG